MFGILQEVTSDPLGSALAADAATGETDLSVDDAMDFAEDGGQVLINGDLYDYTASDHDAATLTLATGLLADAVTGDPVDTGDMSDGAAQTLVAWVQLQEADDPVPVTIPLELIDQFPLGTDQAGTVVSVNPDGDGYVIASKVSETPEPPAAAEPPTEVLTLTVVGDAVGLTAVAKGGIEPSTVLDWYLDGVLIDEGTRNSVARFELEADGDPMAENVGYVVSVQTRNSVDVGALVSAPAAQLNPEVSSQTVLAWVAAGFILAGTIQIGAVMTLDTTGITITHPDGRQTYMRADGSGNQFVGQAILDAATILGSLTILGQTNSLLGLLTMGSGVPDPTSKPGVTAAGWDSVAPASAYGYTPRGLFSDGGNWIYTDSVFTSGNVNTINKATGVRSLLFSLPAGFNGVGGVVKIGANYYVLGKDSNRSANWYVYKFDATFTKTAEFAVAGFASGFECALGIDGAGALLIADRQPGSGNLFVHTYTTAGVNTAGLNVGSTPSNFSPTGVLKVLVDTATARYVVSSLAAGTRVFNTSTGARITTEEWTTTGSRVAGLGHDGTNLFTLEGNGISSTTDHVWKYTNLIGTWDFAFTWVDNDAGGSGTAETKRSTIRTVAPLKRAKWTISLPSAPPDDLTNDGANTASLYAITTGGTLVRQTALVEGVYSATYSTLATSGTNPPSVSGFASRPGAIGNIKSAGLQQDSEALVDLLGAGGQILGPYRCDDDGVVAGGVGEFQLALCTSDANPTSTTNVTVAGLSLTLDSPGVGAVWKVTVEADVQITTGGTINLVELLVDGVAQTPVTLITQLTNAGRVPGAKSWRVTGLAAGSHTITARTRNTAGATNASVKTNSQMTTERKM